MSERDNVSIEAELNYRDLKSALEWLERAFGFEPTLIVTRADGVIIHARMELGEAAFALGYGESPASLGGTSIVQIHVRFKDSIRPHYERAVKAGAAILAGPTQEFYGDMTYTAADIEGHVWRFAQKDAHPPGPPPEGWNVNVIRAR